VFIENEQLASLWNSAERYYIVSKNAALPGFEQLLGKDRITLVAASGGKFVLTNHPLAQ